MVTGTGNAAAVVQWVEGSVSAVEASAFSLVTTSGTGRAVRRYLLSRYASPRPVLPSEGARVRVGLDKAGYVRLIEPLGEAAPASAPSLATAPPRDPAPPPSALAPESLTAEPDDMERAGESRGDVVTLPDTPPVSAPEPSPTYSERAATPAADAEPARRRPGREVVVTRLACLNTATAILASGTRVTDPEAVLALAEQLERWALRPET